MRLLIGFDADIPDAVAEGLLRGAGVQVPTQLPVLGPHCSCRRRREIAEILGIGESNVSTKIGRLKQRIRDEL